MHCNCFRYYTIYAYISESKNESSDDTSTAYTPFVKAMGYLILNLRDTLNGYVLEKRQMIVSYLLYLRWSAEMSSTTMNTLPPSICDKMW